VDYPDSDGRTPLSYAAELGPTGIVQLLLDLNADINLEDKRG
jgi:ankyrin repeat protein